MNSTQSPSDNTLRYNAEFYASHYRRAGLELRYDLLYRKHRIARMLARAGVEMARQGFRAFEYGFGAGHLLRVVAGARAVVGMEASPSAVARACALKPQGHPEWTMTRWSDAARIPLPHGTFDLVTASHVLEHLPDDTLALAEWIRLLRPGGHLLVILPSHESLFPGSYGVLGKEGGEALILKSLEAHRRSGNRVRQASILSNLGVVCQWEGRWDDALSYYERGREESLKVGNVLNAAVSRINTAEILIDRGEFAEAEAMLQQTLPVWRSSEYRYFLGGCLMYMGKLSLRAGRVDEALSRFNEGRGILTEVGAEYEVLEIDARIAECHLLKNDPDAALAVADELLAKDDSSGAVARLALGIILVIYAA